MKSNSKAILRSSNQLLPIVACVGLVLELSERNFTRINTDNDRPHVRACGCEPMADYRARKPSEDAPTPTWFQKCLSSIYLGSLPLPRKITSGDPAFSDSKLRNGIRQRDRDEQALRSLQLEIQRAQQSRDPQRIRQIFEKVTEIAYGKGVTAQIREDFIARHGCTGWTGPVLDELVKLAENRGIVEMGAGHGQWARALTEHYYQVVSDENRPKAFDFVLAYDDMTELPLSTDVYHKHTQPAHDFFFSKVRQSKDAQSVLKQWTCRGRVLLLVYPPPGSMARETIEAYAEMGPENDTVVYVGEGRGGCTADESLFDYLEKGEWALLKVLEVQAQPGGKGYEKLFIFKRQLLPKTAQNSS